MANRLTSKTVALPSRERAKGFVSELALGEGVASQKHF